jgi:hypothetical protein
MGREILEFWTSLVTELERRWQILVARIPGQEMNSGMEELVLVAVVPWWPWSRAAAAQGAPGVGRRTANNAVAGF